MEPTFEICSSLEDANIVAHMQDKIFIAAGLSPAPKSSVEEAFLRKEVFIMRLDKQIAGYYIFRLNSDGLVYPISMGIDPDYRKQGLGTQFLVYVAAQLRSRGAKSLKVLTTIGETSGPALTTKAYHTYVGQETVKGVVFDAWIYDLTGPPKVLN